MTLFCNLVSRSVVYSELRKSGYSDKELRENLPQISDPMVYRRPGSAFGELEFMGPVLRLKKFVGVETSDMLFSLFVNAPQSDKLEDWIPSGNKFDLALWSNNGL